MVVGVGAGVAVPVGAEPGPIYGVPVEAPVRDPFRAPVGPYGAGNRGIEYDTEVGEVVRASADGRVVFAGAVGGTLHVTVLHADGVRTSSSFLRRIDVAVDQEVHRGDPLGLAGDTLHFGARRGDQYFDPASLFTTATAGGAGVEVELLPLEIPPGGSLDDERRALVALSQDDGGGFLPIDIDLDLGLDALAGAGEWVAERALLVQHYASAANPVQRSLMVAAELASEVANQPPCSDEPPPRRPVAGKRRRAILVGGLGSSSESASVDDLRRDELGYAGDAVERFSYTGPDRPYTSPDTQGDLVAYGRRLADDVQRTLRDHPGATVDVYAHSMGGVVARLALVELERRGVDLDRLGLVVTLGSPHHGADLATAAAAANATVTRPLALDLAESAMDTGLNPQSTAVAQLAETSAVVTTLDEVGVPEGVELVSVAASGDLIVASPNTRVDGARNVTVSLTGRDAHSDVVGADETTDEIARALAGKPQACRPVDEIVDEALLGHGISYVEDAMGLAALNSPP